jgi:hypothetical protein
MKKDKHIEDELREQSPFLSEKFKENKGGFKIPEGYFETLPDKILDKVEEESATKVVHIDSLSSGSSAKVKKIRPYRLIATAASVMLLIVAGLWVMNPSETTSQYTALEQLNEEGVLQYLDENMDEFDFSSLVESGIVMDNEIDFKDISELSDEETDIYIDAILEGDAEEI